jgi:hypothetical protein
VDRRSQVRIKLIRNYFLFRVLKKRKRKLEIFRLVVAVVVEALIGKLVLLG